MPVSSWLQPLPRRAPLDRVDFILDHCRGKRVLHLGFVDEHLLEDKVEAGRWLHAQIAAVAAELKGVDVVADGIDWARNQGYEVYVADVQDENALASIPGLDGWAQVIVAGELIEHLDAPGFFLRAVKRLLAAGGELIVTTPNAYRPANALVAATGRELIHPDHTGWHSPSTLRELGTRAGYKIVDSFYYQNPARGRGDRSLRWRLGRAYKTLLNGVCQAIPGFSDGLIVVYAPQAKSSG